MPRFSTQFGIGKSQAELDFIDVHLEKDNRLFIDPFALSLRSDRWGADAHALLVAYFQTVVNRIRENRIEAARQLLSNLRQPNETRLGLSRGRPQGAGIGEQQATELFEALRASQAVQTGFLNSLEECERKRSANYVIDTFHGRRRSMSSPDLKRASSVKTCRK